LDFRVVKIMDEEGGVRNAVLAAGHEKEKAMKGLSALLRRPVMKFLSGKEGEEGKGDGKWRLSDDGKGLERAFKFKTFKQTWEFMNRVVDESALQKHHPGWSNVYNTVFMRWTTHSPSGLSEKDILMAQFCDTIATEMDEQPLPPDDQSPLCLLPQQENEVATTASHPEVDKWKLTTNGQALERAFKFNTFKACLKFMNTVSSECKAQKHHPEWSNVVNTTFIRWTTHSPPGLSEKDILMARFCDSITADLGKEAGEEEVTRGRELANVVALIGKGCCVPKKKEVLVEEKGQGGLGKDDGGGFEEVLKKYKERDEYRDREEMADESFQFKYRPLR